MRYIKSNGELNDDIVVGDMKKAIFLYEDGAILEAQEILVNITNAISEIEDLIGRR